MNNLRIASPSYKRAGETGIRKWLPKAELVVHESEAQEYREKSGEPIVVAPDDVGGNIARVRNWILDYYFDDVGIENLVMMDDDVNSFGYHEQMEQFDMKDPQWFRSFLRNGFIMAQDLGVYLWGVNQQTDPKFYREYTPFSFLVPVLGPMMCIRKNDLRFDEDLPLKEDYDYAIQQMHEHHKILRLNKYFYRADHIENSGGVVSRRTKMAEMENARRLQEKWGSSVVKLKHDKGSINPTIKIPLKGI